MKKFIVETIELGNKTKKCIIIAEDVDRAYEVADELLDSWTGYIEDTGEEVVDDWMDFI